MTREGLRVCPVCEGRRFLPAIGAMGVEPVPCVECAGGAMPGILPASVDDPLYAALALPIENLRELIAGAA